METSLPPRRRAWRIARWVASVALLASLLTYVGISLLTAHILTQPNNRPTATDPAGLGDDAETWSARTADGLTLRGWYCPTPAHRRLVVLVHGMGGSRDEMARLGHDLHAMGYDVLLFDLRGHGSSDRSRLYMGGRERADLRAVLAWSAGRGYTSDRVGWLGYSMGASTLLMEAAQNGDIQVAVLDSPFGNLPELLRSQLSRHSHLPSWFNPGILIAARLAFGVRTDNLVPLRSALRWGKRPILLIHGEADSIVPVNQARQIARAIGPTCQAVTLPGVEHVGAYNRYPTGYIATVDRFFDRNLGR
jgi:alpha-beta hydrolase superfamily lysophospholipase